MNISTNLNHRSISLIFVSGVVCVHGHTVDHNCSIFNFFFIAAQFLILMAITAQFLILMFITAQFLI